MPVTDPDRRTEARWARELESMLGPGQVLATPSARKAYDCDAYTIDKSKPSVVVLPETTEQVRDVVRWCNRNQVPYTPRGAGTGLSGGALAAMGGVLISTKRMTRILEVDLPNRCLRAQAGAVNKRISESVAHAGLHFAPDPSSQTVSTLGGNIAENSGGPHTLKYGVTVQHVLALTMVDVDGEIVQVGSKVPGGPGLDLLGVLIGSEGTMGVVTEAWVRLTPNPAKVETVLASFATVRDATQTVADIIAAGTIPAALEMMDEGIMKAVSLAFGLVYPEGAKALLLIECDGDPDAVAGEMRTVLDICAKHGAMDVAVAADEAERQKLWTARKKGIGAMGRIAPTIVTQDGVIPRSKLPEMLDRISEVAARRGIGIANIFHAGDGNLHPCMYFDDRDPAQVEAAVAAGEEILEVCLDLGGSLSGEHGIGVEKIGLMERMFGREGLDLMMDVRRIFNDGDLCNPCKILPNQKGCVEHMRRWRGAAW
ncbi:MAG: FAD-binding protein [Fimbriimonadaceae bacterium]|nr:FAD-binding protein [Fimbriimonadaceae bacterium]